MCKFSRLLRRRLKLNFNPWLLAKAVKTLFVLESFKLVCWSFHNVMKFYSQKFELVWLILHNRSNHDHVYIVHRYSITLWNKLTYVCHHNPFLIRNHSWILTIHKARILRKHPLEKTFLHFKKWVKSIQTAGYNGLHTVRCKTEVPKTPMLAVKIMLNAMVAHTVHSPL